MMGENLMKETNNSKFFILFRDSATLTPKTFTLNERVFRAVGAPFDRHANRMVGTLIKEEDLSVEIVLHEEGIVMITKETPGTTKEFYPKDGKLRPFKYAEVLAELNSAYEHIFNETLKEHAVKTILRSR